MTTDILSRLEQLAEAARNKAATAETHELVAYWRGVLFGLETAIAEIQQGTNGRQNLH